ncbi:MAG: UDP-N-acetylmuramoyl-tripeptide--D-alanyl-D-alanine ligase [Candidatus Pacebacteria bacterium]|nr:UDP-N-acetylmuramoyl-tripeptide--D-alanyl-D-alanine ligase [Candidatus Paceibacterota bacterium]
MRKIVIKILNLLAKETLHKYNPIVIGITGGVGKSSTKKIVHEILKDNYSIHCDRSRYNVDIGIPLTILGLESGGHSVTKWMKIIFKAIMKLIKKSDYPDVLILEMGVNRPGDMKKMLKVVKPHIAIMTTIGKYPSHIKYFKDIKHIFREKSLLIKSLGKKDLAILNCDDEFIDDLKKSTRSKVITYGFDQKALVRGDEILLGDKKFKMEDGSMGMTFKISHKGTTVPFRLIYALGKGQIYSTLAAVSVGINFDMNLVKMSQAVLKYRPLAGRMNLIGGINNSMIIDDTFNANPGSMFFSLETIRKLSASQKIAVLGDMLELGEYCQKGHREVGKKVLGSVDILITFGSRSKLISQEAIKMGMDREKIFHFEDMEDVVKLLSKIIENDTIVLVKGSRAMNMEKIVKKLMAEPKLSDELLVK